MTEEKKSFWTRLFGGSRSSVREQKVLEYIVYRMNQGANLRDVVGEEYVRRSASGSQISNILSNPRIVEAARERIRKLSVPGSWTSTSARRVVEVRWRKLAGLSMWLPSS